MRSNPLTLCNVCIFQNPAYFCGFPFYCPSKHLTAVCPRDLWRALTSAHIPFLTRVTAGVEDWALLFLQLQILMESGATQLCVRSHQLRSTETWGTLGKEEEAAISGLLLLKTKGNINFAGNGAPFPLDFPQLKCAYANNLTSCTVLIYLLISKFMLEQDDYLDMEESKAGVSKPQCMS